MSPDNIVNKMVEACTLEDRDYYYYYYYYYYYSCAVPLWYPSTILFNTDSNAVGSTKDNINHMQYKLRIHPPPCPSRAVIL